MNTLPPGASPVAPRSEYAPISTLPPGASPVNHDPSFWDKAKAYLGGTAAILTGAGSRPELTGAVKEAGRTVLGPGIEVGKQINKIPGVGEILSPTEGLEREQEAL